jgi:low affinity Fe/Cu permease
MQRKRRGSIVRYGAERLALAVTRWTGSSWGFGVALGVIVAWAVTGPLFRFSDSWQLVINTGTTIVTFLMVFLIQRTQNKESQAIHLKLNEIVAALQGASNRLINVEDLTEDEVQTLHRHYARLAAMAKRESDLGQSHSVEEAEARHHRKRPAATSGPGGPPGC